jgi:hypothetical protein
MSSETTPSDTEMRANTESDKYDELDDEYDYPQRERIHKPVNNRMATLKWTEGALNRHRNNGVIK